MSILFGGAGHSLLLFAGAFLRQPLRLKKPRAKELTEFGITRKSEPPGETDKRGGLHTDFPCRPGDRLQRETVGFAERVLRDTPQMRAQ